MSRFGQLDDTQIEAIVDDKDSKNTKMAVKQAVNIFREFLTATGKSADFEQFSEEELNTELVRFWPNARQRNGDYYKKKTLDKLRFGLKKYIKEKMDIDIDQGNTFRKAQTVFKASIVDLKKKGYGVVKHKDIITDEDMTQLFSGRTPAFDSSTPSGLQNRVWFSIMYYLGRRGQENLHDMTKNTYQVAKDPSGLEYVFQSQDELDKNHRADDNEGKQGKMYARPGMLFFNCEISIQFQFNFNFNSNSI